MDFVAPFTNAPFMLSVRYCVDAFLLILLTGVACFCLFLFVFDCV